MIIKAACALLAGLTGFIGNRLRERREDRAAAVVVLSTLREALDKTHEPQLHPVRPVVIPFFSYAEVWNAERKALAKRMTDEGSAPQNRPSRLSLRSKSPRS
jgi:nucleoside-diphosphate-sugar epimerase